MPLDIFRTPPPNFKPQFLAYQGFTFRQKSSPHFHPTHAYPERGTGRKGEHYKAIQNRSPSAVLAPKNSTHSQTWYSNFPNAFRTTRNSYSGDPRGLQGGGSDNEPRWTCSRPITTRSRRRRAAAAPTCSSPTPRPPWTWTSSTPCPPRRCRSCRGSTAHSTHRSSSSNSFQTSSCNNNSSQQRRGDQPLLRPQVVDDAVKMKSSRS